MLLLKLMMDKLRRLLGATAGTARVLRQQSDAVMRHSTLLDEVRL